ncbi:50S ribosomal protein 5 alpha, chloroplastic-like [Chenopodium quinoa]|uniref:50S ribosomal protein 5 alpha, chloroplastic-like n=1 Tax=Chenopodium quinoa TaxID=63459 RepID=UPI000B79A045|nr:50S ribosomal protein 5 alpha, chloroplastic-like [Chenopodium quinoa]
MALLSPLLSLSSAPPFTSIALSSSFPTRLQNVCVALHPTFGHSLQAHGPVIAQKRGIVVAMVSAAEEPVGEGGDQSADVEDKKSVENLPLESKLQLKLEQKIKMKMAKKIRLRRNRLMRKRKMRKKGRWPPSKMKKLKNV